MTEVPYTHYSQVVAPYFNLFMVQAAYLVSLIFFQIFARTVATYWIRSGSEPNFQTLSDAFGSTALWASALGAGIVVYGLQQRKAELFPNSLTRRFSWTKGLVLSLSESAALVLLLYFLLLSFGLYEYVGFLVSPDGSILNLLDVLIRLSLFAVWLSCDELISRGIWGDLFIRESRKNFWNFCILFSIQSAFFILSKVLIFQLSWTQILTLWVGNGFLVQRLMKGDTVLQNIGWVAGLLMVSHLGLSIPVFGLESTGIWMSQYQIKWDAESPLYRLLSGGSGGILSSWVLILGLSISMIVGRVWKIHERI